LEDEVGTLRAQVTRLHTQVERLQDELRDARLARDRAQEEASTERARYVQMLEEFFRRYVSLNNFTRTVLRTEERGEVMRWPARLGQRPIL